MRLSLPVLCASFLAASAIVPGSAPAQLVGEPAPPLFVERWLKGTPVPTFERGRVYLVDVWAPWCGPCLGGMSHLTQLQRRYRDRGLVVIGLTGPDDYGSTRTAAEKVLREKGDAIDYAVAWDADLRSYRAWMALESDEGWPWAFLVDRQGRLSYSGHPERIDGALESVVAGTFDLAAASESYRRRRQALDLGKQIPAALRGSDPATASVLLEKAATLDTSVANRYVPGVYAALARLPGAQPGPGDAAALLGRRAVKGWIRDDRGALRRLANVILDSVPVPRRDLALAREAAERAAELSGPKDAGAMTTLARARFLLGDYRAPIELQRRAAALADPKDRRRLEAVAERYERVSVDRGGAGASPAAFQP